MSELNILIRWVITSGIFYAFELTILKFKWIAQFNCCLVIRRHTEKGLQKSKEKIKDNSKFVRESCYRQLQWWVKYISWKEKTVKAFFFFSFWKHVIWIARVLEIASREHFQLWPLIFRFGIHLFTFSVSFFCVFVECDGRRAIVRSFLLHSCGNILLYSLCRSIFRFVYYLF